MANLKYRLLLIVGLLAVSAWSLFPRTVVERVKRNGVFVYDTVNRVPLKRGLDLQGGMHLELEIDESKQVVADKSEALDRALKVVRQRIEDSGAVVVASTPEQYSSDINAEYAQLKKVVDERKLSLDGGG